ncbi:MAG: glycosyltransferase family 39 protein [Candidatus Aureabacteria bacterium]|nr:glycosyltransferase family 39 protein [Candidatus Auribacterota bacterium]
MDDTSDYFTDNSVRRRRDLLILALIFSVTFFAFLGRYPLLDPDEGRYAEVPREMIESGDYITPHLDYVKFLFKPPLFYWMVAASYRLFGVNEFAARFPGALCGFLLVLITYLLGRRAFQRREGLLAALVLGTSGGFVVCARLSLIDLPLTLFLTAALGSFCVASRDGEPHKRRYYHLFYVYMALAVMTKGLIGVLLPAMIIFWYLLLTRRWRLLGEMRLTTGIIVMLAICVPWFILVSRRNPEFFGFFFINEHFRRFLAPVHQRQEFFGFFAPILLLLMLPWSCLFPWVARYCWISRRGPERRAILFLALWAVAIFVFFSLSKSTLITYILPILPPLAILTGAAFSEAIARRAIYLRRISCTVGIVLMVAGAGGIFYPYIARIHGLSSAGCGIIGGIFIIGGIWAFTKARRNDFQGFVLVICAMLYTGGILANAFLPAIFTAERSTKRLALIARERMTPDTVLTSYMYEPSLAFYTGKKFIMVDADRTIDLEFGSTQAGELDLFLTIEQFQALWDSPTPVMVLMKERDMGSLEKRVKKPINVLGRQGIKLLATNVRDVQEATGDILPNSFPR